MSARKNLETSFPDIAFLSDVNADISKQPYKCPHCGKSFRRKSYFQQHVRLHTGEASFVCNICSKGFCQQSHLKEHMRIHTGEKPFKCKLCDYCAIQSSHLRVHYGTKHSKFTK